ncbi:DUF1007 family protein [Breoghania sp.]|uniref:DUF1007 family protein n=1 Tax=Breoghania sp. TaxID=2065378 RepID=UPI0029C9F5F1|nr:DUF1007 family protein [Breoghania sp.]
MSNGPRLFSLKGLLVALPVWLASMCGAFAHPHVFVEARSEMVFGPKGMLISVRQVWRFDAAFTAFAVQGLDANGDGTLSHEELQPLAQINVESLKEFDYFTFVTVSGKEQPFVDPTQYWLDFSDGRLTLFFDLPLKDALKVSGGETVLEVFDPDYFVDFAMTKENPFVLGNAPTGCKLKTQLAGPLDPNLAAQLSQLSPTVRDLPPQFQTEASTWSNEATLTCP